MSEKFTTTEGEYFSAADIAVMRRLILNGRDAIAALAVERQLARNAEAELAAAVAQRDALAAENQRLRAAIRVTGGLERLAQCPSCLAERTNGEHHAADCALLATPAAVEPAP